MNSQLDPKTTTEYSIYVQFVAGVLGIYGLFQQLPPEHQIISSILQLEMGVQLLEFIVYLYLYRNFNLKYLATYRYYDWVITTPVMLFTVSLYFTYMEKLQQGKSKDMTVSSFFNEHKRELISIMISNFLMLVFGYLGETGAMNMIHANVFGFIAFAITFFIIYNTFVKSEFSKKWFSLLFTIWGLYGVAALQPVRLKNNMFNGLDIVAKNAFGVYLVFVIHKLKKE